MTTYCEYCLTHPEDTFNKTYHDTQYGFPLQDDNLLFERLILEINQAGLSWITILKKADNFRKAYHSFDIAQVAKYGEKDRTRLLADQSLLQVDNVAVFDTSDGWLLDNFEGLTRQRGRRFFMISFG